MNLGAPVRVSLGDTPMITSITVGQGRARKVVPLVRDRTQRHLAAAIIVNHLNLPARPVAA